MAGLMDMYAAFNAPQVSTGDYANVQQRKNDLQNRRFSGLGEIASRNSIGTLQQEYRAGTGRFAGLDPDRKFQVYYDALKAIDPATAETEQARYNTERQRRVGSEVASAYTSGGREPAIARLMQDSPEQAINFATKTQPSIAITPEAARQQLRIARDNAIQAAGNQTLSDAQRKQAAQEASLLASEMAKESPSIQGVYEEINKIYAPPVENVVTTQDATGTAQVAPAPSVGGIGVGLNNLSSEINRTLSAIKYKGTALNNAVVSLRDKVNNSGLEKSDKDVLLKKIADDAALKGGAPAPVNVDKVVDAMMNDSSTKPVPAALTLYTKSKNAYSSANSALESNAIGAAIANFLYTLRPEAVNEGDIDLAKSSVRDNNAQGMRTVLGRFGLEGFMTTDYKSLANQLGKAAYDKLAKARKESINQVVSLNDKLDSASVEKRASVYFPVPEPVYGSAKTTVAKKERRQGTMEDFE